MASFSDTIKEFDYVRGEEAPQLGEVDIINAFTKFNQEGNERIHFIMRVKANQQIVGMALPYADSNTSRRQILKWFDNERVKHDMISEPISDYDTCPFEPLTDLYIELRDTGKAQPAVVFVNKARYEKKYGLTSGATQDEFPQLADTVNAERKRKNS